MKKSWVLVLAVIGAACASTTLGGQPGALPAASVANPSPVDKGARVIVQTPERLKVGIMAVAGKGEQGFLLHLADSTRSWKFGMGVENQRRPLDAGDFRWMWGTAAGTSALLDALADLVKGNAIAAEPWDVVRDGIQSPIEAVALFEKDGDITLLTFVGEQKQGVQIRAIRPANIAGCSATLPEHACSCSASASGASCSAWTDDASGTGHAQCTDSDGTTICASKDQACECVTAP